MRERPCSSLLPLARVGLVVAGLGHAIAGCSGNDTAGTTVDVPSIGDRMDAATDPDAADADGGDVTPHDAMAHGDSDAALAADGGPTGDGGAMADGGISADGAAPDEPASDAAFPAGDPTETCSVTVDHAEFDQGVGFSDEGGFAVTLGGTGFGVAFHANDCGAIGSLPVAATGAYRTPLMMMFGQCNAVEDVSLLHVDGGFRMAWVDNSAAEGWELQTLLLSEALTLPDAPMPNRVTTNARRELRPAQWQLGGAHYLTWISADPDRTHTQIEQRNSDTSDSPQVLIAADAGFNPTRFAAAQVGTDQGVLAFVSESSMPGAWLLPLDNTATPVGSPLLLSSAVTTGNAIDVATREIDGGAVVYSIDVGNEHEVRFRRLDSHGAFAGDDIKLLSGALRARDAGIAHLGDGYVVGFRALPASGEERGEIRMMFITKEGNVQRDSVGRSITYPVTDASPDGGRVSVRISTDGQLLISFLDTAAAGTKLRLIRKRLDCAL